MKPNPICFTKQKFRFKNEGDRDFEKKRTDEISYTNLCSLLDVTLSIRASLLFSLYIFAMCVLAFFLYLYLLFSLLFFFFYLCVLPLFIERLQRSCSLIFLSTNQIMEQLSLVFPPQFLIPCWVMTHYSTFCSFYLFCLLFKFPLFGLWHPHFSAFQAHFHETLLFTFR